MAEKLKQFVAVNAGPYDELRSAVKKVRENRRIDNAVGDQLEQIKKVVVLEFEGTDSETRDRVQLEIEIDDSEGEYSILCSVTELLFNPDSYYFNEIGNANLTLHLITQEPVTTDQKNQLKSVITGGVGLDVTFSSDNPFVFFEDDDPLGEGFYDENEPGSGGIFVDYL